MYNQQSKDSENILKDWTIKIMEEINKCKSIVTGLNKCINNEGTQNLLDSMKIINA